MPSRQFAKPLRLCRTSLLRKCRYNASTRRKMMRQLEGRETKHIGKMRSQVNGLVCFSICSLVPCIINCCMIYYILYRLWCLSFFWACDISFFSMYKHHIYIHICRGVASPIDFGALTFIISL